MENMSPFEMLVFAFRTIYNGGPAAWIIFSIIFLMLLFVAKKLVPTGADWFYYRRHPNAKLMDEQKAKRSGPASCD